jgi:hypothetical protein
MIASGSPMGAALAAPVNVTTLVANKADTAKIRSEVDMVVPFKVGCADRPRSIDSGNRLFLSGQNSPAQARALVLARQPGLTRMLDLSKRDWILVLLFAFVATGTGVVICRSSHAPSRPDRRCCGHDTRLDQPLALSASF